MIVKILEKKGNLCDEDCIYWLLDELSRRFAQKN